MCALCKMLCMKTRNQSKPSAWVVIIYVVGGISAGLLALIMISFALVGMEMEYTDHVRETPEWVEKNYHIPCESLQVKEAIFDMDSNELEVQLETPPPEQFGRALEAAGWKRCGNGYIQQQREDGRKKLLWLEYISKERALYACIGNIAELRMHEQAEQSQKN